MEEDNLKNVFIQRGYISEKCELPSTVILSLARGGENPCKNCSIKCEGYKES